MSNMGYCRFRNTLEDLEDCADHFGDEDLSEEEQSARRKLMSLCESLTLDYGEL